MSASKFELISQWRIEAERERVWNALHAPADWPRWWPYVASVVELDRGNGGGIGARHQVSWTSRLPYNVELETRVIELEPQRLIRIAAAGDVRGEGCWRLSELPSGTCAEYTWRVELDKAWMRALAPLLRPVFKWNHNSVMDAGERGLRAYLTS
jgi:hypothetical protein